MDSRTRIQKIILPALILVTPFLVFLDYNSYCLGCAETWIALSGLILLAMFCSLTMLLGGKIVSGLIMAVLITAFIDIQFTPRNWMAWAEEWAAVLFFSGMQTFVLVLFLREKFYTITTSVFLTFFAVTVLQLILTSKGKDTLFEHHQPSAYAPPRIIHLILDEHIGIEGIPTDIQGGVATKNFINQFYLKNGFHLFGGAFSRHFKTHHSLQTMVNFAPDSNSVQYNGTGFTLLRNRYFELLSQRNYRIEALSTGFVDFCSGNTVPVVACQYDFGTLHTFAKLEVPVSRKFQVVISRYLTQSTVVSFLIREAANLPSLRPLTWAFELDRMRLNSLGALHNLSILQKDASLLTRGTALVAHLMLPHAPYVAQADCSIRPPGREFLWHNNNSFLPSTEGPTNTTASREERYKLYFEQLQCLYLKLDALFDRMRAAGVYDESIIVLHGDHGSRIFINEPTSKNQHVLTKQDLVDGFSTLFAMKLPGKTGGYDASPIPLEQLFAKFAFEAGLSPTNILSEKSDPYVYLMTDNAADPIRIPYIPPN